MKKAKKPAKNILQFIQDSQLIGSDLSLYQETALALLYGLPLSKEQKAIAQKALDTESVPRRAFA